MNDRKARVLRTLSFGKLSFQGKICPKLYHCPLMFICSSCYRLHAHVLIGKTADFGDDALYVAKIEKKPVPTK